MSFRSSQHLRQPIAVLAAAVITLLAFAAFAVASDASMKGSYYKAMLKEKKSKKKASSATKAAMKGTSGFYGFKLKGKKAKYIPAKNGTLIWTRDNSKVQEGASRTDLVLYSSKSVPGNKKIVVSGTVSLPEGPPPAGGWPVISWAHGTTGLADQCAPSRYVGNYGTETNGLLKEWLEAGYAVAATDYPGLGTPGVHPYLVGDSEGRGILDIVKAARQLDVPLSKQVVLTGHSQGGQAILFAAKLAKSWGKGDDYRGTVSYAPASNLKEQIPRLADLEGQFGVSALALSIVRGMTIANPKIKSSNLLSPAAAKLYAKVDKVCYSNLVTEATKSALQPGSLLKSGWERTTSGKLFQAELVKQNPNVKVSAPVLIPQGLGDTTVLQPFTKQLVDQLRVTNAPSLIDYQTFPSIPDQHSGILLQASDVVNPFIAARFGR